MDSFDIIIYNLGNSGSNRLVNESVVNVRAGIKTQVLLKQLAKVNKADFSRDVI